MNKKYKIGFVLGLFGMILISCSSHEKITETEVSNGTVNAAETEIVTSNGEMFIRWIDCIEDLPDYAVDFYQWLVENSGVNGILADFSKADRREEEYCYNIRNITDTVQVSMEGVTDLQSEIYSIVNSRCEKDFEETLLYADSAFYAFEYDCPQVFWLQNRIFRNWFSDWEYQIEGEICQVTYTQSIYFILESDYHDLRSSEYREYEELQRDMILFEEQVTNALAKCEGMSDYEKVRYFNQWLAERNQYNTEPDQNSLPRSTGTAISAIMGREGADGPICSAYARAFKVLCDRAEIPCLLIDGEATNSADVVARHEWNQVQMPDGNWYGVDVTWNDQLEEENLEAHPEGDSVLEQYLLVGKDTMVSELLFSESHVASNIVSEYVPYSFFMEDIPPLASEKYMSSEKGF